LPLPGYVGDKYLDKKILFIGQSPGQPGPIQDDGYWAGVHHFNKDLSVVELRKHYYEGLVRCNIGLFIKSLLDEVGLSFDEIAFTNVVKCAIKNNEYPSLKTINFWTPYLTLQLELLRPRLIVCLGRLAKDYFNKNSNFFDIEVKKFLFNSDEATVILYLPHPSYISRNLPNILDRVKEKFKEAYRRVYMNG